MSLFKQVFVIFSILLFLLLSGVLYITFENTKEYSQAELYEKANNTASSLSLSMSQLHGDTTKMSTMANAVFDTGNYKEIYLEDIDGKRVFDKVNNIKATQVPSWFCNIIDIKPVEAVSEVSNGWNSFGVLHVVSDVSSACRYLYRVFLYILSVFVLAFIFGLVLLSIFLKIIFKPLKKIEEQALKVLDEKYTYIEEKSVPYELKEVVSALNKMVKKMHDMYMEIINDTHKKWQYDFIDKKTGIGNRRYFYIKYKELKDTMSSAQLSDMLLIKVDDLEKLNSAIGYKKTDELIKALAKEISNRFKLSFRISASEFLIIGSECGEKCLQEMIKSLRVIVDKFTGNLSDVGIFAVKQTFYKENSLSNILSSLDLSLKKIISSKKSKGYIISNLECCFALSKQEWQQNINSAIRSKSLIPKKYIAYDNENIARFLKINFDLPIENSDINISYGDYAIMLKTLGLFDSYMDYLFEYIEDNKKEFADKRIIIECFMDFLYKIYNFDKVVKRVEALKSVGIDVVIEIKQSELLNFDKDKSKTVIDRLHHEKIKIGVLSFDIDRDILEKLYFLRPEYIRIYADQFLSMSENLRQSILLASQNMGTKIILSDIKDDKEKKDIKILKSDDIITMY